MSQQIPKIVSAVEDPEYHAPLVKCPRCGSDCQLEEVKYPSEKDPTYEFEFVCDQPFDEDEYERPGCATWFRVKTDEQYRPLGLVEVGMYYQGAQQYYMVPWEKVRKTRQSGRFKPCTI
jgi:hypothetical protein